MVAEDRRAIGRRVRAAREDAGWTQRQLGAHYGCSHAAISDIERGVTKLEVADIRRLAALLGTDFDALAGTPASIPLLAGADVSRARLRLRDEFVRHVRALEAG